MADYIKIEDVAYIIKHGLWSDENELIYEIARSVPSIDVVNVVRCKDCKWRDVDPWDPATTGCRWYQEESPDDYDYCSFGERADT